MSRWTSNATWHEPKGTKTPKKGAKRARHVALGARHDALGLQHDVARVPRNRIPPKGGKTSAPRRIGATLCRVGPPTRRGSSFKGPNPPKKRAKRARHVALGVRHVALDLQHDVAPPQRCQSCPKGSKKSAPRRIGSTLCRVGPPTRRGSPTSDSIILRQALINGGVIILVAGVVAFVEWVEIFS